MFTMFYLAIETCLWESMKGDHSSRFMGLNVVCLQLGIIYKFVVTQNKGIDLNLTKIDFVNYFNRSLTD